ncbi:MAG: hypothetical protein IT459_08630 [Planctomycetes bacterium]|nr:hypothetical protein [Planctomycetota bacterium]
MPSTPSAPRPGPVPLAPTESAIRGWQSRLACAVSVALALLCISGIWIWVGPFSTTLQVQALAHALLGVAVLAPLARFLARHVREWWGQKLTVVMVLGYLLAAFVLACCVSGVVATIEAARGPSRDPSWETVHLVGGIGTSVLLPVHVVLAWARRRNLVLAVPALATAQRRFALWAAVASSAAALSVIGATLVLPQPRSGVAIPADYSLPDYAQKFDEYRGSPFAPAYARTSTEMLVDPSALSGSDSCGSRGCHEEILAEWQPSAHRFAAMNPPFQAVQEIFAEDRGAAETRYCAGCHDPVSLFAGAKDLHRSLSDSPGTQEGVSCAVCHSISTVDQRGNADYVITPPTKYLWEGAGGWRKWVSDFLVRAVPRQHLADYDRNVLRAPEFCGACHKQFIPEALNRFGTSPGQNQFDEWRQSHWHTPDSTTDLSCRDCHMRLVTDSRDPGRGERGDARRSDTDGKHRHHGTIATNILMPMVLKLPHWERHVELTREWIRGETVLPEIDHVWPRGPVASVAVLAPTSCEPDGEIELRVVVRNEKAGHSFTTGPLDFMQAWVHLTVHDASGSLLAEWGRIDPTTRRIVHASGEEHVIGNRRDEGTLVLEGMPLDADGKKLERHELWRKAGGLGVRQIYAGYSDAQSYRIVVPAGSISPLTVSAQLNFRRYRQDFLDLVVPHMERERGVIQPWVTQDDDVVEIRIERTAPPSGVGEGEDGH